MGAEGRGIVPDIDTTFWEALSLDTVHQVSTVVVLQCQMRASDETFAEKTYQFALSSTSSEFEPRIKLKFMRSKNGL